MGLGLGVAECVMRLCGPARQVWVGGSTCQGLV